MVGVFWGVRAAGYRFGRVPKWAGIALREAGKVSTCATCATGRSLGSIGPAN